MSTRLGTVSRAVGLLAVLSAACRPSPPVVTSKPTTRCHYRVHVDRALGLSVRADCDGDTVQRFIINEPPVEPYLRTKAPRTGQRIEAPGAVAYRIDLDALARRQQDPDVALRRGSAVVSALSTWLARPQPVGPDVRIEVEVVLDEGVDFATAATAARRWSMRADEIRFATYAVVGRFDRAQVGARAETALELVTLPGRYATPASARNAWVASTADAVARFWGQFPVARAMIVWVPARGYDQVLHGKVVGVGGAGMVLQVGEGAAPPTLQRDWILIHEMFHLGMPSFSNEGRWLDEGLATYYEPIIAARAGRRSVASVWDELIRDMRTGTDAAESVGLEQASSYRDVYWGGAAVAFLADVRARQRSGGRVGLEDGLRAIVAKGGNATQAWRLAEVIATIDHVLGAPIVAELTAAHANTGSPLGLAEVFENLGVRIEGDSVVLDDAAPLAHIRRAIVTPP